MTTLRERPDVRPPEVEPRHRPVRPRRPRGAAAWWTIGIVVVLTAAVALAVWLIARDDTPAEVTPQILTEVTPTGITRDPKPGEILPVVVVEPVAPLTGDASDLAWVSEQGFPSLQERAIPESGDASDLAWVSEHGFPSLQERTFTIPESGDAFDLEWVSQQGFPSLSDRSPMGLFGYPFVIDDVGALGPGQELVQQHVVVPGGMSMEVTMIRQLVELPNGEHVVALIPLDAATRALVNPSTIVP